MAAAILAVPNCLPAAQRAFFIFQSPSAETVPANVATNVTVTLTYSNASGTINGAVFTNGVAVSPAGQGVTASLSSIYAGPVDSGGGTTNLTLTISAASNAPANTTYEIIVSATNKSFTANTPIPGVASLTNTFIVGPPANSNAFSIALSPRRSVLPGGHSHQFHLHRDAGGLQLNHLGNHHQRRDGERPGPGERHRQPEQSLRRADEQLRPD